MPSLRLIGFAMVVAGVIVNNYVYLHDVIVGDYVQEGAAWTLLGTKSYIGAGLTFAAVIAGAVLMLRRTSSD